MGNRPPEPRSVDIGTEPDSEPELIGPEMLDKSKILTRGNIIDLYNSMPARLQCAPWKLTYSTHVNGYSLLTMYRLMESVEGPVLVVVKDFQGTVFGVLTTDPLLIKPRWFGHLDSFLYTFKSKFRTYGPTFANYNCIACTPTCVRFGGSRSGLSGLYLGDDFCDGSSHVCDTYNNGILSKSEYFLIRSVEMWTFFDKF
ncbi:nuclear receptor coactivator 7-like [Galendromus occidentalis]|uniref:Oxidation resistance protein 1 n=1 Tax=Galendromus occidentalis TaxID=34638 RepID=A0AAJ7SGP8_9ACAR|nr:nuclear receptor coactivator 7-like [Galendromus occidentalis]